MVARIVAHEQGLKRMQPASFQGRSKCAKSIVLNLVLVDAFSKIIINVLSSSGFSGSTADLLRLDLFIFSDLAWSIIFLKSCLLISAIFTTFAT